MTGLGESAWLVRIHVTARPAAGLQRHTAVAVANFGNGDVQRACRKIPAEFARESGQRSGVLDQIGTSVGDQIWIQMMGIVLVC
jgi:hypothetical protein